MIADGIPQLRADWEPRPRHRVPRERGTNPARAPDGRDISQSVALAENERAGPPLRQSPYELREHEGHVRNQRSEQPGRRQGDPEELLRVARELALEGRAGVVVARRNIV